MFALAAFYDRLLAPLTCLLPCRNCCKIMLNEKHKVILRVSGPLRLLLVTHIHFAFIQARDRGTGEKSTKTMTTGCCIFSWFLTYPASIKFPIRSQLKHSDAITKCAFCLTRQQSQTELAAQSTQLLLKHSDRYSVTLCSAFTQRIKLN